MKTKKKSTFFFFPSLYTYIYTFIIPTTIINLYYICVLFPFTHFYLWTFQAKAQSGDSINSKLSLVVKSGKYALGFKSTLRTIREGQALVVFISDNCPRLQKSQLEYYGFLSKTPIHIFSGNNNALGTACGRLFGVSVMTIIDAGDADLTGLVDSKAEAPKKAAATNNKAAKKTKA